MRRSILLVDDTLFGPHFRCEEHRNWIGYHKQDVIKHLREEHGLSMDEIKKILEDIYGKAREVSLFHRSLNFEDYLVPFDPDDFNPEVEENIPYTEDVEPCTEVISVRVGPLLKLTIVEEAKRRGVSVSHLIRSFIRRCLYEGEDEEDER